MAVLALMQNQWPPNSLGRRRDDWGLRTIERVRRPLVLHKCQHRDGEDHGFQVPFATAGTKFSMPGGGKSSVVPCSALWYAVISTFTTSRPSSNVSAPGVPSKNARTKWRAPA